MEFEPVYRGLVSRYEFMRIADTWLNFKMADDNIEEGEQTNELASLALDANKQREFEDKVKRISAQVSRGLCLSYNS